MKWTTFEHYIRKFIFFCRAGEEDSSHSADVLLRRTGGAAGIAPLPWRSCSTIGWYWISTVLSGNNFTVTLNYVKSNIMGQNNKNKLFMFVFLLFFEICLWRILTSFQFYWDKCKHLFPCRLFENILANRYMNSNCHICISSTYCWVIKKKAVCNE